MPASSAAWGSRLVSVSPGIALTSSTNSSPLASSSIRSTRAKPAAAEQPVRASASSCARVGDSSPQLGGAHEPRAPDRVARREVVEVLLVRHRLDDRQRLVAEHRHRELAPVDVALEQHLRA